LYSNPLKTRLKLKGYRYHYLKEALFEKIEKVLKKYVSKKNIYSSFMINRSLRSFERALLFSKRRKNKKNKKNKFIDFPGGLS